MRIGLYALAASACLMCASANATIIGVIDAGVNGGETSMAVLNISSSEFSNVEVIAVSGVGAGEYEVLGALASNYDAVTVPFSQTSGAFASDYAAANGPDATTSYRVEVTIGSTTYYSNVFSPETNMSGQPVNFLGNGNVTPTTVAEISSEAPAAPELTTLAMMTIGFAGLGFAAFHKRYPSPSAA
jgi:hypothetical protein